jgi:hypothetical protein
VIHAILLLLLIVESRLCSRYRISSHANDEMADDFLVAADIEHIILTGEITRRFTHAPRGTRYEVLGDTVDYR